MTARREPSETGVRGRFGEVGGDAGPGDGVGAAAGISPCEGDAFDPPPQAVTPTKDPSSASECSTALRDLSGHVRSDLFFKVFSCNAQLGEGLVCKSAAQRHLS